MSNRTNLFKIVLYSILFTFSTFSTLAKKWYVLLHTVCIQLLQLMFLSSWHKTSSTLCREEVY